MKLETAPGVFIPAGPMIVDTHSYKLSPLGPAEQLAGGSLLIVASSVWIRLADEDMAVTDVIFRLPPPIFMPLECMMSR